MDYITKYISTNLQIHRLPGCFCSVHFRWPIQIIGWISLLFKSDERPHAARTTWNKLQKIERIGLMPHPADSPDLAPADYFLFQSMARVLHSRRFNNQEKVETSEKEFLALKKRNGYQRRIKELAESCLQTLQARWPLHEAVEYTNYFSAEG